MVGLKSDFTILGTDDQLRLMKQVLADQNIDEKRWPPAPSPHDRRLEEPRPLAGAGAAGRGERLRLRQGRDALYRLPGALSTLNAVDFGDLLLLCLKLWRENKDILEGYQDRFRYILVDEYQDTNVAQYLWLRLLAQKRKNVACVGDDDQSIYGWRGAEVDNILRFEHDFPARPWSAWSATTARRAISSPPPPASSPRTRAAWARRCAPRTSPANR